MKRYQFIFLLIFSLLYITLRVIHFINVPTDTCCDLGSYVQVAKQSIFTQEFWSGTRSFTYPLIIKVFNFNLEFFSSRTIYSFNCSMDLVCFYFFSAIVHQSIKIILFYLYFIIQSYNRCNIMG